MNLDLFFLIFVSVFFILCEEKAIDHRTVADVILRSVIRFHFNIFMSTNSSEMICKILQNNEKQIDAVILNVESGGKIKPNIE